MTAKMTRPRVVVVDDHHLVRAGVIAELGDAAEIVGEADDIEPAVETILRTAPDVVLLDVHLPSGSGDAVIEAVSPHLPDVRFRALSVSDAPEDVLSLVRAGARGYVTKRISGPELTEAVHHVLGGDAVFSPRLAGFVLDAFAATAPAVAGEDDPDDELHRLTQREREVMQHLARGYSYKEIARELSISVRTVESHTSAVLRKLQLSSRHELTHWAARRRLV